VASRDRDDAMAGLLRRNLAGDAGAGNDCPAPHILAAYFERSLGADETARFELHFSQCARCREQLTALARANEFPAAARETPRQTADASWLWDWRWLAPVAVVLLFAVVWFARRPVASRFVGQPAGPPLVAMSQPEKSPMREPLLQANVPTPSASPAAKAAPGADKQLSLRGAENRSAAESSDLKEEKSAKNPSRDARKDVESDALSKTANATKRDADDRAENAVVPRGTSESVAVESAAPATAPTPARAPALQPALKAKEAPAAGMGGGVAGGVVSAQAVPESASARKKQAEGTRSLVQQAQTQTVYQSRALALAADNERAAVIQTPDAKVLWRIASGGFVEQSEDGGATWQGQLPTPNAHLVAGSAPGPNICWFVGDDGIILLTKDAKSWHTIRPPVRADLTAVTAQDASSAIVTAADGRKFTTTNHGKTWTPAQ
jgi:hypothetical protein